MAGLGRDLPQDPVRAASANGSEAAPARIGRRQAAAGQVRTRVTPQPGSTVERTADAPQEFHILSSEPRILIPSSAGAALRTPGRWSAPPMRDDAGASSRSETKNERGSACGCGRRSGARPQGPVRPHPDCASPRRRRGPADGRRAHRAIPGADPGAVIPGAVLERSWDAGRTGLVGAEDRVLVAVDGYRLAAAPQGPAVGQQRGRAIALEGVQHPTYLPWRQSERSLYCAYTSAAAGCVPMPLS